jgi:hypothetical protein
MSDSFASAESQSVKTFSVLISLPGSMLLQEASKRIPSNLIMLILAFIILTEQPALREPR